MGKRGRPPSPDILTPREFEVLELLREGLSNPEIAERLGISRDGAKYHVSEILSKLGVESREEAARWQPEEARPWWAGALAPFAALWRRLPSFGGAGGVAARAVAASIFVAGMAGIGVLVWGLLRTDGAAQLPDLVEDPGSLRWSMAGSAWSITSVTPATCGDAETAGQYGVPRMLRVEGTILGSTDELLLGLEPEPYNYQTAGLHTLYDVYNVSAAPRSWELLARDEVVPSVEGPPRFDDVFLRRLDRPDELFRYYSMYCDQEDGSPTDVTNAPIPGSRVGGEPFAVPDGAPIVLEHVDGDYISLDEALKNPGFGRGAADVVVAELGRQSDLELLDNLDWSDSAYNGGEVQWFVLLRLTDVGPVRPGDQYGIQVAVNASEPTFSSSACCMRLVEP